MDIKTNQNTLGVGEIADDLSDRLRELPHERRNRQDLISPRQRRVLHQVDDFDVLLTTDRNIRYQQNLTNRKIAIVVLGKGRWRLIRNRLPEIAAAVAAATPGSVAEVQGDARVNLEVLGRVGMTEREARARLPACAITLAIIGS